MERNFILFTISHLVGLLKLKGNFWDEKKKCFSRNLKKLRRVKLKVEKFCEKPKVRTMKVISALFLGAFLSSVSSQGFAPFRQVSEVPSFFFVNYVYLLTRKFHGLKLWKIVLKTNALITVKISKEENSQRRSLDLEMKFKNFYIYSNERWQQIANK